MSHIHCCERQVGCASPNIPLVATVLFAGHLQDCEQLYKEALTLCPTYPSVHYNLGVLASEGRHWTEALRHYQDTLALAPHHAQVCSRFERRCSCYC